MEKRREESINEGRKRKNKGIVGYKCEHGDIVREKERKNGSINTEGNDKTRRVKLKPSRCIN